MTEQELDNVAEGFAKSYVASIAGGTAEEMNRLATFDKAGFKAGFIFKAEVAASETFKGYVGHASRRNDDPYGEYFKKESEEEIIDEDFSV